MANETEEQQIAELKKWWSENATSIIIGVALGLSGVFGVRAWLAYQDNLSGQASTRYAVMLEGLDKNNSRVVSEQADVILGQYGSTPYAPLAALALAKTSLAAGDLDAARTQLQWVLDNGDIDVLSDLARLRLARVLIAQQQLDEAEALLQQSRTSKAFDHLYAELSGDISTARQDIAAATAAYQQALAVSPADNPGYHLLQLKYDNALAISTVTSEVTQ